MDFSFWLLILMSRLRVYYFGDKRCRSTWIDWLIEYYTSFSHQRWKSPDKPVWADIFCSRISDSPHYWLGRTVIYPIYQFDSSSEVLNCCLSWGNICFRSNPWPSSPVASTLPLWYMFDRQLLTKCDFTSHVHFLEYFKRSASLFVCRRDPFEEPVKFPEALHIGTVFTVTLSAVMLTIPVIDMITFVYAVIKCRYTSVGSERRTESVWYQ